jgi:hypothetical protein
MSSPVGLRTENPRRVIHSLGVALPRSGSGCAMLADPGRAFFRLQPRQPSGRVRRCCSTLLLFGGRRNREMVVEASFDGLDQCSGHALDLLPPRTAIVACSLCCSQSRKIEAQIRDLADWHPSPSLGAWSRFLFMFFAAGALLGEHQQVCSRRAVSILHQAEVNRPRGTTR